MISTLLASSRRPGVAVSGGMDSLVVLDQVRQYDPNIEVLVFKADFTEKQWSIIDNLIREWGLTVIAPPLTASYFVPNGPHLARVDEYGVNNTVIPVLRDLVHDDARCSLDLGKRFATFHPLDHDLLFVGTRRDDGSPATGQVLQKAVNKVGNLKIIAPIFYWTDEEVRLAAEGLPYSKEWYENGDETMDTGNLVACSRCVQNGKDEPVFCPKVGEEIPGHIWDQGAMLKTFREKFGFIGE